MAETNIPIEPALPTKRKMDSISSEKTEEEGNQDHPIKTQKLRSAAAANNGNTSPAPEENNTGGITPAPSSKDFGSSRQENAERAGICENGVAEEGYDDEDDDDDDDEDDGDEEEEEEDAVVNGEPVVVDRKGKGIMIEEKDDEDDDSDDDEDGGSEFDGDDDSDLEDDPLAEVDLDNILPSRTRRRSVLPGVYIANDNDDGDEDDSDE